MPLSHPTLDTVSASSGILPVKWAPSQGRKGKNSDEALSVSRALV